MEYSPHRVSERGFPVEFAAMGFLIERPCHGYALRARLADGLGPLWQVASSQLYQVLHRLEESGWVGRSDEIPSGGPARSVYHVTAAGKKAFWAWGMTPVEAMRNVRVEFVAKLYFLRKMRPRSVATLMDRQLAALPAITRRVLSEDRGASDDPSLNAAWAAFQLSTIDNFRQWLRDCRKPLQERK